MITTSRFRRGRRPLCTTEPTASAELAGCMDSIFGPGAGATGTGLLTPVTAVEIAGGETSVDFEWSLC